MPLSYSNPLPLSCPKCNGPLDPSRLAIETASQWPICALCAASNESRDIAATGPGQTPPVAFYLSSDGKTLTGFLGNHLAQVRHASNAGNHFARDLLRLRAITPAGQVLVGTGRRGMYCRLRIARQEA